MLKKKLANQKAAQATARLVKFSIRVRETAAARARKPMAIAEEKVVAKARRRKGGEGVARGGEGGGRGGKGKGRERATNQASWKHYREKIQSQRHQLMRKLRRGPLHEFLLECCRQLFQSSI
jgi:hypothetical protein